MSEAEYHRHKILIVLAYKKKMMALKEMYPKEWKMDHDRASCAKSKSEKP